MALAYLGGISPEGLHRLHACPRQLRQQRFLGGALDPARAIGAGNGYPPSILHSLAGKAASAIQVISQGRVGIDIPRSAQGKVRS